MRLVKVPALLACALMIVMLVGGESSRDLARAQAIPGTTLVPPAAPGQPVAFPTIGALPALAPAPGTFRAAAALAKPQPTPRVFRCSCSAPGIPTQWIGTVPAPSYFLARRQASAACTGFNVEANAPSPYITAPRNALSGGPPPLQNGTAFNGSAQTGRSSAITIAPIPGAEGQIAANCRQCACS